MATLIKKKKFNWGALQFILGHDGIQADMVLEKELEILHLVPKAAGSEL